MLEHFTPFWCIGIGIGIGIEIGIGIGKDSLGIVYDFTHCYNLEKKCVPPY